MKDIEDDYLKTIDRQAELDVQMATLQDLRPDVGLCAKPFVRSSAQVLG
jgi:hypothetical protein